MNAVNPLVNRSHVKRRAFTLVELMVVVAIMAVLAALVAGVVIKATEAQRNSNTLTTMEVIKSSLSKQLQAVIDDGKDKERKGIDNITNVVNKAFPIASELSIPVNLSKNYQQFISKNPIGTNDPKAVLVRMILEAGPFSKLETDLLPKGALSPDKPVLLDAWGDPITLDLIRSTKVSFKLSSRNISGGVSN